MRSRQAAGSVRCHPGTPAERHPDTRYLNDAQNRPCAHLRRGAPGAAVHAGDLRQCAALGVGRRRGADAGAAGQVSGPRQYQLLIALCDLQVERKVNAYPPGVMTTAGWSDGNSQLAPAHRRAACQQGSQSCDPSKPQGQEAGCGPLDWAWIVLYTSMLSSKLNRSEVLTVL